MLHFIYNPKSGSGKGEKIMGAIADKLNQLNVDFSTHPTNEPKHATLIAKELSLSGATDIIALGGDGTISEVLNGIDVDKVNMGIIPAGSGNDFIVSAKIPLDPLKALDIILNGEAKPTDFLNCSGVRGLNVIGAGIDVEVLERCQKSKFFKGKLQYVLSLLVSLIKFKFYHFEVVKKDQREEKNALIVCCGNGKIFGGGIKICPEAKIDDGLMDFIVCDKMSKWKIPNAFMKLMKGKILEQWFTQFSREEHVEVIFDRPTTINVDGELYPNLPFNVSIEKGKLKLFRP